MVVRSRKMDAEERRWNWNSEGVIRDGTKHYSSIVRGQEVIALRDTVYIYGNVPSEPYVAQILSFHENLTDSQACADIYWYFRPDEMRQRLCKILSRGRPELPTLAENEVVMSNVRETIEISSIAGLAVVKRLTSVDTSEANSSEVVVRFRFDVLKNAITSVPSFSALEEGSPVLESPSGSHSNSPQGRVRHRSKGELRPVVPDLNKKRLSPTISPCSKGRGKKYQYKDVLNLASPSVHSKHPASPLLKSHTFSGVTTPSKSCVKDFDSLLPVSVSRKRSAQCSPQYWVGKKASKAQKLGNSPRDSPRKWGVTDSPGKGSPGKGSPGKYKTTGLDSDTLSPERLHFATVGSLGAESPVIKGKRYLFSQVCEKSPEKVKVLVSRFTTDLVSSGRDAVVKSPCRNVKLSGGKSASTSYGNSDASKYLDTDDSDDAEDSEAEYDPKKKEEEDSEEEDDDERWTPRKKTPRTPAQSRVFAGGTPKSSLKAISARRRVPRSSSFAAEESDCDDILSAATPRKVRTLTIPEKHAVTEERKRGRKRKVDEREELLEQARERLHVSAVPDSLPCRDEEFSAICRFVEDHLHSKTGGCMYISGMPGVGKTALVREVARYLRGSVEEDMLPPFKFVEVNGMKVTGPPKIFVSIVMQLTGRQISVDNALAFLKKYATSDNRTVLLVDEVDYLYTKKQKVLYELFSLPGLLGSKLTLLVVTNTLDLHERVMKSSTTSRLGLTRVDFKPYTHQQLQEIVKSRLDGLRVFEPDAVELASRKLAAKCGDARRVLDVCRRAVEIAGLELDRSSKSKETWLVGMRHLQQAMNEMCNLPMVNAIKHATRYEKKFLLAIVALFHATGQEETTMRDVYTQLKELFAVEGLDPLNFSQMVHLCSSLCSSNIIVVSNTVCDMARRVKLVPNLDDVVFALREQ